MNTREIIGTFLCGPMGNMNSEYKCITTFAHLYNYSAETLAPSKAMSVTQLLDVFVLTSVEPVGGAELVSEQLKPAGILFGFYLINQSYFLSFL